MVEQVKGISNVIRMPRLGKIRLGIKVANARGVEYPKATDYFVCPEEVQAIYGEKPNELLASFPLEDETIFARQSYSYYTRSRGLVCRGNGVEAMRLLDTDTGALPTETSKAVEMKPWRCHPKDDDPEDKKGLCPEYTGEGYKAPQCRLLMQLQVLLPDVPGIGVWQIDTGSFFGIVNLNSCLATLRGLTGGRISMIPVRLRLRPQEVQVDGLKKNVHVLQFVVPLSLAELHKALAMPRLAVFLPAPEAPERDLEFAPPDGEVETRVVDPAQAEKDIEEMWDGLGEGPPAPDTQPETPEASQPQTTGGSGDLEGTDEQRVQIENLLRVRWAEFPNSVQSNIDLWCRNIFKVQTITDIPEERLAEALKKAQGK